MTELLSCPWCGGNPYLDLSRDISFIICNQCNIEMSNFCENTIIEIWNTRASPWVKTSERLPSHEGMAHFICYGDLDMPNKIIDYGSYAEETGNKSIACFVSWITGYAHEVKNVTHWMPAPELPGEE